jgi:drug/metabolite transporter (DMT)-like permease
MKSSGAYVTLYTSIILLSLNGLFSNGLPLDAITITQIRSALAGLTLVVFIFLVKGTVRLPSIKTTGIVYGLGLLLGLHWATFFYAMQSASVAIGMLALFTYPIMTTLIEPFFTKKPINTADISLGLLALLGLLIIVSEHLSIDDRTIFLGVISGISSAMFFASRNVLQKYYCSDIPSETLMLHQVIATVLLLSLLIDIDSLVALSLEHWGYLALLGVITTAIAHTLVIKSHKTFSAKTVAMISCLQPVFGSVFAWLVLDEWLSITTMIGGSIILGVAIYESTKSAV